MRAPRVSALLAAVVLSATAGFAGPAHAAELLVSAAVSLTNAFREIGMEFERGHTAEKVAFNFGASDVLLTQIVRGAPADVFASADREAMDRAVAQGVVDPTTRVDFARNGLVLIVQAGKPAPASLADLRDPSFRRIALGNPAFVPAGRYAKAALDKAGLWPTVESRAIPTQNVRQSLDYVARGECDAGFVYATDAALMPDKVRVAFAVPTAVPVLYPVAVVNASANRRAATAFVDYLRSRAALAILARHGFGAP